MQRGSTLTEVVVEPGVSGGIPFAERPEGGRLWAGLQQGDVVVAAKLDRMFRSAADCLAVVEAFKARGVSLCNGGWIDHLVCSAYHSRHHIGLYVQIANLYSTQYVSYNNQLE